MDKFKQCTYTILLMITCFIASPFILRQIWKNSAEAKNPVVTPPPVVSMPDSSNGAAPNGGDQTSTQPADAAQQPSENPDNVSGEQTSESHIYTYEKDYPYVQSDASYFNNALFIGDSRTVGIKEYGTLKNADYFCSVGLAASKINTERINDKTFDQVISEKQYGKVYVMLGINEIGNDFESTATAYRVIVEKIKVHQPNAIIYIQGNLHVSLAASTSVINNDNINYLNSLIATLADYNKVFYIDINQVYDDEHGDLTAAYTSDGIHPLAEYYKQWCEFICSHTVPVNEAPPTEIPTTEATT